MAVGLALGAFRIPNPRRGKLLLPTLFGLDRISPQLYFDRAMPAAERSRLLAVFEVARDRVQAFWGEAPGQPTICACSTAECYHRFGGGRDRGQTSFGHILLSPRGLDAVVMSHEWTHAELSRRCPLFATVPAWFSEGLAAVASADPLYDEAAFVREIGASPHVAVSSLETLRQFLDAPHGYLTAAHEIRGWLSVVGQGGLLDLVAAMRRGEEFHHAYHRLEADGPSTNARPR